MRTHRVRALAIATAIFLLAAGIVAAFGIGNVDGVWQYVEDGGNGSATCDNWASMTGSSFPWSQTDPGIQSSGGYLTDENQVRYGRPVDYWSCPSDRTGFALQSGFGFDGVDGPVSVPTMDTPFYLGSFKHYNNPIYAAADALEWVDLTVTVPVDCDGNGFTDTTFTMYPRFNLDETPNDARPCKYPDGPNGNGCSDQVLITQPPNTTFTCGDYQYTVNIYGFTTNTNCSTVFDPNAVSTRYLTAEQATNTACLWAEIDAPLADARVTKACYKYPTNTVYPIVVTNEGPGTALGAKLVDTLPSGVSYASYTSYRTIGGVRTSMGTCSNNAGIVTCELNGALPETTGDPSAQWEVNIITTGSPTADNTVTLSTTSQDTLLSNNTAIAPDELCVTPSAVELVSFTATGGESSIELAWETATETDNVGFNLYRAEGSAEGTRSRLNAEIIPAANPGTTLGSLYGYTDSAVSQGVTYYYWLEDIDTADQAELYGPASASLLIPGAPAEAPVSVQPVLQRPVRELPVIELPTLETPAIVLPVLQVPVIIEPWNPAPAPAPAPVLPGPIAPRPFTGLPVQGGLQ